MKSAYGMFDSYGGDLLTQKSRDVEAAANSKVAGMDPKDSEALAQFRAANPNATPEAERIFLTGLAYSKAANQNSSLLGDIGTGLAISFGDRVPEIAGGLVGLLTGSQSAMDYVAKQQREAEQSREEYSVGTQEAQQEIRRLDAEREASYKGKDRTAGDTAMDFLSTLGDYIANPRAAVAEAAESGSDIALMMVSGGTAGAATKAAVKQTAAKSLLAKSAAKTAGNRGNAAAMNLLTKAGHSKDAVKKALAKEGVGDILRNKALTKVAADLAEKAGTKAAGRAAGAVGVAYTGYSEGVSNGIQTYQEVMGLSDTTLNNSKDFRKFKEANPNLSKDELKKQYALGLAKETAVESGTLAAAIGKLTGASDNASKALLGKNGLKNLASKSAIGGTTEAGEESLQSGGGQLISNINVAKADESKDTLQGVGHTAGAGAASGGLLGASMAPIGSAAKLSAKAAILGAGATAATAKGVVKVVGAIGDAISSSVSSKKETKEEADLLDYAHEELVEKAKKKTLESKVPKSERLLDDNADLDKYIQSTADLTTIKNPEHSIASMAYWADKVYDPDNAKDVSALDTYSKFIQDKLEGLELDKVLGTVSEKEAEETFKKLNDAKKILMGVKKSRVSSAQVSQSIKKAASKEYDNLSDTEKDDISADLGMADFSKLSDEDLATAATLQDIDDEVLGKINDEIALRSAMKDVSTNFTKGGKSASLGGNVKGAEQHVKDFAEAIRTNDTAQINETSSRFNNWFNTQQAKVDAFSEVASLIAGAKSTKEISDAYAILNSRAKASGSTITWGARGATVADQQRTFAKLHDNIVKDFGVLERAKNTLGELAGGVVQKQEVAKKKSKSKQAKEVQAPKDAVAEISWKAKDKYRNVSRAIKSVRVDEDGNYRVSIDNPESAKGDAELTVDSKGNIIKRRVSGAVIRTMQDSKVSDSTMQTVKNILGETADTAPKQETPKGKKTNKESKAKKEEAPKTEEPPPSDYDDSNWGDYDEYAEAVETPTDVDEKPKEEKTAEKSNKEIPVPYEVDVPITLDKLLPYLKSKLDSIDGDTVLGQNRKILQRILDSAPKDIKITYVNNNEHFRGLAARYNYKITKRNGKFISKVHSIDIALASLGVKNKEIPKTELELLESIIHELDHAATLDKILADSIDDPSGRYAELERVYSVFAEQAAKDLKNGKLVGEENDKLHANISYVIGKSRNNKVVAKQARFAEFLTYARTNEEFANYLRGITISTEEGNKNLLTRLLDIIVSYFSEFKNQAAIDAYVAAVGLGHLYQDVKSHPRLTYLQELQEGAADSSSKESKETSKKTTKTKSKKSKGKSTEETKESVVEDTVPEEDTATPSDNTYEDFKYDMDIGYPYSEVKDGFIKDLLNSINAVEALGQPKESLRNILSSLPDDTPITFVNSMEELPTNYDALESGIHVPLHYINKDGKSVPFTKEKLAERILREVDYVTIGTRIKEDGERENPSKVYTAALGAVKTVVKYVRSVKQATPATKIFRSLIKNPNTITPTEVAKVLSAARTNKVLADFLQKLPSTKSTNMHKAFITAGDMYRDSAINRRNAPKYLGPITVESVNDSKVIQVISDGVVSLLDIVSAKEGEHGVTITTKGSKFYEGRDTKGNWVFEVNHNGEVFVDGIATGESVHLPTKKEESWAKKAAEKLTNIHGLKVARFAKNFMINTTSGSLLARKPNLFKLDFSSWSLPHARANEFASSASLQDFKDFLNTHYEKIRASIEKDINRGGEYTYQNWMADLVEIPEDRTEPIEVPDAVITGVAASMYSFILNDARSTAMQSYYDVRRTLEKVYGEDNVTHANVVAALDKGVHRSSMVFDLGSTAMQALGMVTKSDADVNARENMRNSLGLATLRALIDAEIVQENKINTKIAITQPEGDSIKVSMAPYYKYNGFNYEKGKPVKNAEGRIQLSDIDESRTANDRSESRLFNSVLAIEVKAPPPSTTPLPRKEVRRDNKGRLLGKRVTDLLNAKEQVPHEFNPNLSKFFNLPAESFRSLIRAVSGYAEDTSGDIDAIAESKEAVNLLIDNTVDNMLELKESLTEEGTFYYPYAIWSNHREGQGSNLSMQRNKIARNLIVAQAWKADVEKEAISEVVKKVKSGKIGQTDAKYAFLKGVGQGLGVEEQSFSSPYEYILAVQKKLKTPAIEEALKVLQTFLKKNEQLTSIHIKTIAKGVAIGGEDTHSFLALAEYAGYLNTAKGNTYTTNIYVENDGKTSALAITAVQLSSKYDKDILDRVGIFSKEEDAKNQVTTFGQFKGKDAYYTMAGQLIHVFKELRGLKLFYGDLFDATTGQPTKAARQLSKHPTMTPLYGAGMKAVVNQLLNAEVLPKVLEKLNRVTTHGELTLWASALNTLLPPAYQILRIEQAPNIRDSVIKFGKDGTISTTVQQFVLPTKVFNQMAARIVDNLKAAHTAGMINVAGTVVDNQITYGNMISMMGQIYKLRFDREIDDWSKTSFAAAVANGYTKDYENYVSTFVLSRTELKEIHKKLEHMTAAIPDALFQDGDSKESWINMLKEDETIVSSSDNSPYRIKTSVSGTFGGIKRDVAARFSGAVAMATHAGDAAVALGSQDISPEFTATLNVHDANIAGINTAHRITGQYNTNFHKILMSDYSYFEETLKQLKVIVNENDDLISDMKFSVYDNGSFVKKYPEQVIAGFEKLNKEIQATRAEMREKSAAIDQYTTSPHIVNTEIIEDVAGMSDAPLIEAELYTPKTIMEVFKYLGANNTRDSFKHTQHLTDTLLTMHAEGLQDIQVAISKEIGKDYSEISATDMMVNNMRKGPNRYARRTTGNAAMSAQEFYVNELAYAIGGYWVDNSTTVRDELKRMHSLAMDAAKKNPELWDKHKDIFDSVFNPTTVDGKATYLQNFFSAAVSNEGIRTLLTNVSVPTVRNAWFAGDTFLDKITNFLNTMVRNIRGKAIKTVSTRADARMDELLRHIVTLDSNNRGVAKEIMDKMGSYLDGRFSIVNKSLAELLEKPAKFINESESETFRKIMSPITLTHLMLSNDARYTPIAQGIKKWTRQAVYSMVEHNNVLTRELGAFILQATGRTKRNSELVNAFHATKQSADRARMQILPRVASTLKASFDPDKELTASNRKALTYVLAKADLSALLDIGPNIGHTMQLVANDNLRKEEIARVTSELNKLVKGDSFYRIQAQNLGWLTVDGSGIGLNLPRYNAYAIAKGRSGTDTVNPAVEKLVDQLASLYALEHIPAAVRKEADEIIQHEMNRVDEEGNPLTDNGILNTLYTLLDTKEEARKNLFKGAENLMQKGYIGDRFPARMQMAFSTVKDDSSLLSRGYTMHEEVGYDPTTGHKGKRYLYISPYGGLAKLETGAFVLDAKHSRGTDVMPPDGVTEYDMNSHMSAIKAATDKAIYASGNLRIKKGKSLAMPKWDTEGKITGYRMMMSESLKDSLMQRETDIFSIAADLRASSYIKSVAPQLNKDTLQAIKSIHDQWGQSSPEDFVYIGEESKRKEDRAYWASLPYETRMEAIKMFGKQGIPIRRDSRAIAFGTREWAISDIWNKPEEERRLIEKVVHSVATQFFGNSAAVTLSKTTDLMEALARIAKDAIVIRGFLTTVGNTLSNLLLNSAQGINPVKQLRWGAEAYTHARRYLQGASRTVEIETLLTNPKTSAAKRLALKQELAVITEDMRVSPVRELIESGALQNIEEIGKEEQEEGLYSAIPFADKVSENYRKVVKKDSWLDTLANNVVVSQASGLYKQLSIAAQMSDFTAKYAYVKSKTEDSKHPITKSVAIQQANDLFIDYQLPSGVIISSLNRLGFLYFTKYLIRVQKTILKTAVDNPIRSLLMVMGADWLSTAPSIFGSFMGNPLNRLSNPVSMFLDSLDEPIVANMLT